MESNEELRIYFWMIEKLKLKGNDLMVYAVIYREFDMNKARYKGSVNDLAKTIGVKSLNTISKSISKLIDKNLIKKYSFKTENNFPYCEYEINQKEIEQWA